MRKKFYDFLSRTVEPFVGREIASEIWSAARFAEERHAGQMRLGGEPHLNHVLRVGMRAAEYAKARKFEPEQFRILVLSAILHDTLEDTPTTDEELAEKFGAEVARIVRALSHEQEQGEEPDEVYLARVEKGGPLAILVKRCDRLDNLVSLATAPADFRAEKVAQVKAALPIWQRIDPEGATEIETELKKLRGGE